MNSLAKMFVVDGMVSLGLLALAKFAPEQHRQLTEQAKEAARGVAPELVEQLEQAQQGASE